MDEMQFVKLGLNVNEAKVYVMLLKSGSTSAGKLIKATGFHRNIVYDNLEKLADKGLVTFIIEGKKKVFQAAAPEMITEMLEKEQEELNQRKKAAEILKREAAKIQGMPRKSQEAAIFRGVNGLKSLFKDIASDGKDYFVLGAPKSSLEIMGDSFWRNHNLNMDEERVSIKMIFNNDLREWSKNIKSRITQIKFMPKKFDALSETIIYGDKVAIIVWTERPIATLIRDENLAKSYKQYFDILWKQAKK